MKTINIFGGGLFGVLLASELSKRKNCTNTCINLIDQSPSILQSWNSIKLAGREINAGFHGIETPRAKNTIEQLSKLIEIKDLKKINNFKLILIGRTLLPFKSRKSDWPDAFKNDLNHTDMSLIESGKLSDCEIRKELNKSNLGRLMNTVSYRYSEKVIDALHLLYPWFYPFENRFNGKDECYATQNEVDGGIGKTHYLIPKNGIFSSLKEKISTSLENSGVIIQTNSSLDVREALH